MIFEKKDIPLKNGKKAVLRSPEVFDADRLLKHMIQRSEETEFMLKYPDEYGDSQTMSDEISEFNNSAENVMIICESEGIIVGCCEMYRRVLRKAFHRAKLSVGILKSHWGLGIGRIMMEELIRIAEQRGITQLELEVFEGNERAMKLYEKIGFKTAAIRPNCIHLNDGRRKNVYIMFLSLE